MLFEIQPWAATSNALGAISYRHGVPEEIYDTEEMPGDLFD